VANRWTTAGIAHLGVGPSWIGTSLEGSARQEPTISDGERYSTEKGLPVCCAQHCVLYVWLALRLETLREVGRLVVHSTLVGPVAGIVVIVEDLSSISVSGPGRRD
jgi:hypothetical protein